MNWDKITLMVQALMYTIVIVIAFIALGLMYQSNDRMQKEHDRMMREHEATMKMSNDTLRHLEQR